MLPERHDRGAPPPTGQPGRRLSAINEAAQAIRGGPGVERQVARGRSALSALMPPYPGWGDSRAAIQGSASVKAFVANCQV